MFDWVNERRRGRMAATVLYRSLVKAEAFIVAGVEVLDAAILQRCHGVEVHFVEFVRPRQMLDVERPAMAMHHAAAVVFIIFRLAEIRQHIVVSPACIAERRPFIEVAAMAAHIHHAVDRGRSAKCPAARHRNFPVLDAGVRSGGKHRIVFRMRYHPDEPGRHTDQWMAVWRACFEQTHGNIGVFGQAVGNHAACGTRTDNHIVEGFRRRHVSDLPRRQISRFLRCGGRGHDRCHRFPCIMIERL